MIGFNFVEVMEGTAVLGDDRFDRPFRFQVDVEAPDLAGFTTTAVGQAHGRLTIDGFASAVEASGRLELSPFKGRTIRYVLAFSADDRGRYTFDGHKTIRWARPYVSWTTLPGELTDAGGRRVGTALMRFSMRRHLGGLLRSIRLPRRAPTPASV